MSMRQCCASGSLHTGTPTGRVEKVNGLDCYIADPPNASPKGVVVIIPDAFGWTFPNNRILADDFAKNGGFQVYLPEFMDGNKVPQGAIISMEAMQKSGFVNQLYKLGHFMYLLRYMVPFLFVCRQSVTSPRVVDFFKALKSNQAKNLPVAATGYCWGVPFVVKLCQGEVLGDDGKPVVACGFAAHGFVNKFPDDLHNLKLPYSYAAAEFDMALSVPAAEKAKEILAAKTAKSKDEGVEHELVMYDGVHHGFAVRADENDKLAAEQGKKAEAQAIAWFTKWFTKS